ncbi:MAG: hypothetical protein WCE21_04225 [Candidatus Babeliales bacterium]
MQHIVRFVLISTISISSLNAVTWQFVNDTDHPVDIEIKLGPGRFSEGTGKQRIVHFLRTTKQIKNLHTHQSDWVSDHHYCVSLQGGHGYDLFDLKIKPSSAHTWHPYGVRFTRTNPQYDRPTANHSCADATITILDMEKKEPIKKTHLPRRSRYARRAVSHAEKEYTFVLGIQKGI